METGIFHKYQAVFQLSSHDLEQKKPRRAYKRSLLGCLNCKRKKIKCDESKSQCKNCRRSQLKCAWPGEPISSPETPRPPSAGHFVHEPNAQFLPLTLEHTACVPPLNSRAMAFSVSQEVSSSRESVNALFPPKPVFRLDEKCFQPGARKGIPSRVFPDTQGSYRTPNMFSESDFLETLGVAIALAKDYMESPSPMNKEPEHSRDDSESAEDRVNNFTLPASISSVASNSPSESLLPIGESATDTYFLSVFIHKFLPTLAQVNFQDKKQCLELVLAAAKESLLLQEVFIACGASIIAFNNPRYRHVAQERYTKAITFYLCELKQGKIQGGEVWFFVAVQVLQILCLRDMFADSNATRCAAHFGAAYKIISLRLSSIERSTSSEKPFLTLEKIMLENFLFNYSITIFFCDHNQLPKLVPSPFDFFHASRIKLIQIFYDNTDRYKYRSMLAFQIAAKCAWLCRLNLPLDENGRYLHMEILQLAEALLLSFENESNEYAHPNIKATMSIAKVVLNTSLILLLKIIDFESVKALDLQHLVKAVRIDIEQLHNQSTILPIWSLMIAASTSTSSENRSFFKKCLEDLLVRSNSKIIVQILNHLDGLWELYDGEEPFEFMFDTNVLDQVCN